MMKTNNKQRFENLDTDYVATTAEAKKIFRNIFKYPDALGFDEDTDGFIALHKGHSPSGLDKELPACIMLKKQGYAVELINEQLGDGVLAVDARINGEIYEIKSIANATNLGRAIELQFRYAYKKADKILLHIMQPASDSDIKLGLKKSAYNYPSIKKLILLRGDEMPLILSHEDMLRQNWGK